MPARQQQVRDKVVIIPLTSETLLKRTTSRCPVCRKKCPAEVWRVGGKEAKVFLKRTCPAHGEASVCISSDARFYWLAQGDPQNACCGGGACNAGDGRANGTLGRNAAVPGGTGVSPVGEGVPPSRTSSDADFSFDTKTKSGADTDGSSFRRDAETNRRDACATQAECTPPVAIENQKSKIENLSTCLALIEIVNSCNLACPTCYADSPVGTGAKVDAVPLDDLKTRIQGVIDRKGGIEILQLSGGEPTLHPQFFELLAWAHANPGIDYVLLNTNGVRIANDEAFSKQLGETFRYGKFQLYLQFDGVQSEGHVALRGGDLRAMKQRAIERCGELNIPITLAMTVTSDNLPHLWATVEFGLKFDHIRGVAFQPMFTSGRTTAAIADSGLRIAESKSLAADAAKDSKQNARSADADSFRNPQSAIHNLNTADVILSCVENSGGRLQFDDFTPLPCGDPNCATIGYLLKLDGRTHSISEFVDFTQVQGFLRDKVRYSLDDLARCGCESEPLGGLLKKFELDERHTFRLFIKPFMDAWTWDEDRIDRCCTHVIRPDGKLDSFCRYYFGGISHG